MARSPWLVVAVLALVAGAGCRFGQLPNPNKPEKAFAYDGESLQQRVRQVDEVLTERVIRGELSLDEKDRIFHEYISGQLSDVEIVDIPSDQAWRYADVYRQMQDWDSTKALYERAVDAAENEDRRVNDSLRLAEALARTGSVEQGIEMVRSTFDAEPGGKAPILLATLYEFAPAALGHGHDGEVAELLEQAMDQHLQTVVDPQSEAGRAFLHTRLYHLRRAWEVIVNIHRQNGDQGSLRQAIESSDEMLRRFATT